MLTAKDWRRYKIAKAPRNKRVDGRFICSFVSETEEIDTDLYIGDNDKFVIVEKGHGPNDRPLVQSWDIVSILHFASSDNEPFMTIVEILSKLGRIVFIQDSEV